MDNQSDEPSRHVKADNGAGYIAGPSLHFPPEKMKITVRQFIEYLASVGRSSKCPVCSHTGGWIIHAHARDGENYMNVYTMENAMFSAEPFAVVMMQCPQCGFVQNTNANTVQARVLNAAAARGTEVDENEQDAENE